MEKTELNRVIKGCIKNNKSQQKKLYMAFYGFAYGVVLRYAGSREEASIIMNKGFYNVFVGLSDYDNKTIEFKEWLKYRMLLAAIEYLFSNGVPESKTGDIEPNVNHLGTGFSYDKGIKMLHHLPDGCRVVFNLFAIEGYAHEKIATMLQISVNVSKTLLKQARERLYDLTGLDY